MTQLIDNPVLEEMRLAASIDSQKEEKSDAQNLSIELQSFNDRCRIQIHRASRTYTSLALSYVALETEPQIDCFQTIHDETAIAAFQRLVMSIDSQDSKLCIPQITVALYEFLIFTEAYGWQPLFFDVVERMVPILRSQGLETVKQQFQDSEFRYLAYRQPIFSKPDNPDLDSQNF